ncbi:MAG: zinc ribbon domain-containing protein [Deltaproteobacteria bacterium]|nr:zinc ribbon domain-containing protein [Deltaproteobacteria bacterium]
MPVYEYRCESCGHAFEELILRGPEPSACPVCGSPVHKLFSSFSYQAANEGCADLPKGEQRDLCTECRREGGACPLSA